MVIYKWNTFGGGGGGGWALEKKAQKPGEKF